jgi:hypothetical protein
VAVGRRMIRTSWSENIITSGHFSTVLCGGGDPTLYALFSLLSGAACRGTQNNSNIWSEPALPPAARLLVAEGGELLGEALAPPLAAGPRR